MFKVGSDHVTIPGSLYNSSTPLDSDFFSVYIREVSSEETSMEDSEPFAALMKGHFSTIFIFTSYFDYTPKVTPISLKFNQLPPACGSETRKLRIYLSVVYRVPGDDFQTVEKVIADAKQINNVYDNLVVGVAFYLYPRYQEDHALE